MLKLIYKIEIIEKMSFLFFGKKGKIQKKIFKCRKSMNIKPEIFFSLIIIKIQ